MLNTDTVIAIQGTFDIARARAALRTYIANHQWPPAMNARAAAAMTSIGELIMQSGSTAQVPVHIRIQDGKHGKPSSLEMNFGLHITASNQQTVRDGADTLSRIADDVSVQEAPGEIEITARIYMEKA